MWIDKGKGVSTSPQIFDPDVSQRLREQSLGHIPCPIKEINKGIGIQEIHQNVSLNASSPISALSSSGSGKSGQAPARDLTDSGQDSAVFFFDDIGHPLAQRGIHALDEWMMMIYSYIYHLFLEGGPCRMGSQRTIITLSDKDKAWIESYSKVSGISMAEAIRQGITELREREETNVFQRLVEETRGIWRKGDGLTYQEKIRSEWR